MIFDATHRMALLRRDRQVHYLRMQRYDPAPDAEEEDWQALWKRSSMPLPSRNAATKPASAPTLPGVTGVICARCRGKKVLPNRRRM